jgi:hypothetical protein
MWHWVVENREWLFSGAGVALIGVLLGWFLKKLRAKGEPVAGPVTASSATSSVATAQQVNINVSPSISPVISPIVSPTQSDRYGGPAGPRNKEDDGVLPNVGSLRPEVTTIVHDEESDVWSKGNSDGVVAVLLPFSNEPQPGKKTLAVESLKARLTYYQCDRVEEFKRIDSGCWLNEAYRSIRLWVGDIVYLIGAVQGDLKLGASQNPMACLSPFSTFGLLPREPLGAICAIIGAWS